MMGEAPEGQWLADNAHRFGFVLSYPRGFEDETGYAFEPWHYRYIGVEAAAQLTASEDILETYLRQCAADRSACPFEPMLSPLPNQRWIGGPCSSDLQCSSISDDAYCEVTPSGGQCTMPCTSSCPDRSGKNSVTACAATEEGGSCYARCDEALFPNAGCREGFVCDQVERPVGTSARICVPAAP